MIAPEVKHHLTIYNLKALSEKDEKAPRFFSTAPRGHPRTTIPTEPNEWDTVNGHGPSGKAQQKNNNTKAFQNAPIYNGPQKECQPLCLCGGTDEIPSHPSQPATLRNHRNPRRRPDKNKTGHITLASLNVKGANSVSTRNKWNQII